MKEGPRYHIVSMRINDEERQLLDEISRTTMKTVSEIMREAMEHATDGWSGFMNKSKRRRDYYQLRKELH